MSFSRAIILCAMLLAASAASAKDGASVSITEFAWRATLTPPAGATAAQFALPADAMRHFRSAALQDVRVFNANGESVAIARIALTAAAAQHEAERTAPFKTLPLMVSSDAKKPAGSSLRVQLNVANDQGTVWVQMPDGGSADNTDKLAAGTRRLPAALIDTRHENRRITALQLHARLPANILVNMTLWRSSDLVRWTEVQVKGPLFNFDGDGAPRNQVLGLAQPLALKDQYLRLQWDETTPFQVDSAIGVVELAHQPAPLIAAQLSGATAQSGQNVTWPLDFALPMAALQLRTSRANTLVPVRVLGRGDMSQPWRQLAQGVLYRIGPTDQEKTNDAFALNTRGMRWLRVEASHGITLPDAELSASALFPPIQFAFLASGPAPFELVIGRPETASASVGEAVLRAGIHGPLIALPMATLAPGRIQDVSHWNERLLPADSDQRKLILWLVLGVGVVVLAAVAFMLLRQLQAKPKTPHGRD